MSHYDEKSQAEKAKAKQGQQGQPGQPNQHGQQNPQNRPAGQREQDIKGKGRESGNPTQGRANESERGGSSYERGNVEH